MKSQCPLSFPFFLLSFVFYLFPFPSLSSPDSLLLSCHNPDFHHRGKAYAALPKEWKKCEFPSVKRRMVLQLIDGCQDSLPRLSTLNKQRLMDFPPSAFDAEARYEISRLLKPGTRGEDKLILFCGYLGIKDLEYTLRKRLESGPPPPVQRAVRLALARLGDKQELEKIIQAARKMPLNQDFLYEMAPALLYTRQPAAMNILLDIILCNSCLCSSANPSSEKKVACAWQLIPLIAPFISDFPMTQAGSKTNKGEDPEVYLVRVREWIDTHTSDYTFCESDIPFTPWW